VGDPAGGERYELRELLGEGASSRVYRAFDRETASPVAVKVLNPHLRADEVSLERFRREIQITRLLAHPQIVSIYDLVVEPERTFLVMELLPGRSLAQLLAREHPLPVPRVVSFLRQMLEVLSACHARDVVHRDLKPQNVFVDDKDRLKLIDFGIARMTALRDLTRTGTSLGSPEYMAPELFARAAHDPRTDLYALGVVGFELLAGRLPFQQETLAMLFRAHREDPVPELGALREDVPDWLEQMIGRLLAKRPHRRYQGAEEALADLEVRRVVARELPRLPLRRCLDCDEQTLEELAVCLGCGADCRAFSRPGSRDVRIGRGEDPAKLRAFLADRLGIEEVELAPRRTLLAGRVAAGAAETLRRQAARAGVFLDVRRASPLHGRTLAPALVGALVLFCALLPAAIWRLHDWWWALPWDYDRQWTLLGAMATRFVFLLAGLTSIAGGAYLTWRLALAHRPLLRDPGARLCRRLRDHEWLEGLAPALAREPGSRSALAAMIEKYLLLKSRTRLDPPLEERLRGLLQAAARVETLAREIAAGIDDAELSRSVQRYDAVRAALEAAADDALRAPLAAEQARLRARLEVFANLEEAHAGLCYKLVRTDAAWNRLVGARLVLDAPFDELELDALADSLERVGLEAEALQEIGRGPGAPP
jgi:tRNA A-37 threonylcarbamoyl transferase component Bud32